LDYSTSGALVIPLTNQANQAGAQALSKRRAQKYYLAILRGHCRQNFYHINLPIGDDTRPEYSKTRMATPTVDYCVHPRHAETLVTVLNRGFFDDRDPVTKVILKPITGRRHQLRIHCHRY
jgi:23S rRNA-/tRNA-specific pseudouridylate synthase